MPGPVAAEDLDRRPRTILQRPRAPENRDPPASDTASDAVTRNLITRTRNACKLARPAAFKFKFTVPLQFFKLTVTATV